MKIKTLNTAVASALLLTAGLTTAPTLYAQGNSDLDIGRFTIAGYGDVTYADQKNQNNNVVSRFIPIFLFQMSEKIHIESELEFSITPEGETEVEMEYLNMHYYFNDNTVITAGKFLIPFGFFGQNLHPTWINKLPTPPAFYGHGGNGSMSPIIPMISDTGINISNTWDLGNAGRIFTDFYAISGPRQEGAAHGAGDEADVEVDGEIPFPEEEWESKKGDNNDTMAYGGRIAYAFLPEWEVGYSYVSGAYSDDGDLNYTATNIDINWNGSFAQFRSEIINTTREGEFELDGEEKVKDFDRNGWYAQGSWQARQLGHAWLNPVELVLRHSVITKHEGGKRTTFGINYWLEPSAALKVAIEDTKLDSGEYSDDRLIVQLAFGF